MEKNNNIDHDKFQGSPRSYLDIHSHWRNQGIPTLTTLSGTPDANQALWCQWIKEAGRTTAIWSPTQSASLSISWLESLLAEPDLTHQFLQYLAEIQQCPTDRIYSGVMNKSSYELEIFQQQLTASISSHGRLLLHWFLAQIALSRKSVVGSAADLLQNIKLEDEQFLPHGILVFKEILPENILPGLLIEVIDVDLANSALAAKLMKTAEHLPGLPIALSIQPATLKAYFTNAPESRFKSMLKNGLIAVHPDKNTRNSLSAEINHVLCKYDAPALLIDEAHSLAHLAAEKQYDDSIFRSQAELFLFHILELVPDTRGVFKLNVKMPFSFGHQPMEIDLFAVTDQIAVEIDGYYHFQASENWRRDRRKDLILQMHNVLILRFLAEEVVSGLEEIIETIRHVLQFRREKIK
ncbi:Protein of unknown function [Nitrosomonas cryotolerans]|uniref:DUF559 domain-containing protein n=1 Tax=Nitrosomonas cryotolerans ATCC 49181 TaxID=1131553 RepID=A0A1N6GBU4_9PROT|nr:DUF559 domain-containing protein [Nitrosomonas cryotolerans]SFQ04292.1 Protein of unknown function [Nitrosomonas cryotolerans]SIO04995.1 Protein of unknown function [Nitrosomonas cryotolerans ATCC 49181]